MSKADKMFKILGYEKTERIVNDFLVITYINKFKERIIFDLKYKTVIAETENGYAKPISIPELQAINEKVKELGC